VTTGADLEPTAALFSTGADDTTVYCGDDAAPTARARLAGLATVVDAGPCPSMRWVSEHLARRGVRSLLVEGGRHVHTQFLAAGLADELHVAVAPFFVADSRATRVVGDGPLPWDRERRADLAEVRRLEDVVLLRYALSARFDPDGPGGAAA
jgi:5-amino-6-(5-phosphoribosylamino)uracil reductase